MAQEQSEAEAHLFMQLQEEVLHLRSLKVEEQEREREVFLHKTMALLTMNFKLTGEAKRGSSNLNQFSSTEFLNSR